MTQAQAITRLRQLAARADVLRMSYDPGKVSTDLTQMKFEAAGIIASYLGSDHYLVKRLGEVQVRPGMPLLSVGLGSESVIDEFVGLVRAGISLLSATYGRAKPKPPICDPDLWEHVKDLVGIEAWGKIPATVVVFVEDWYRKRGGDPRRKSGAKLVGKDLFATVLGDHSDLVLGAQASEQEGWRFLAMGLAQAIGNLHRHTIEQREDAEQFAWSVIGLGSLLIAEMRLTHPEEG